MRSASKPLSGNLRGSDLGEARTEIDCPLALAFEPETGSKLKCPWNVDFIPGVDELHGSDLAHSNWTMSTAPSSSVGRMQRHSGTTALLFVLVAALLTQPTSVLADDADAPKDRSHLAQDFNDPLTVVPQLAIQDAYTPATYGTKAQTNRLIVRPLIPRVPRLKLLPFVQLIRPSFSLVTVPKGKGSATRTEFGDMQILDLAILPWPGRESGLILGFGPMFIFPTATHETAGKKGDRPLFRLPSSGSR